MDVRIGVTYNPKEIILEMADDADRAALKTSIDKALGDDDNVLWLADRRGREVAIPSSKIAYVEIGSEASSKHIGFGGS
jgi:hypothetical protein